MSRKINTNNVPKAVNDLILDARKHEKRERLRGERYTFFRPASVQTTDGRSYSVFSREISPYGIGLLHDMELKLGQVECRISSSEGQPTTVPLAIIWCEPCGEGWYISGGKFVGVDDSAE